MLASASQSEFQLTTKSGEEERAVIRGTLSAGYRTMSDTSVLFLKDPPFPSSRDLANLDVSKMSLVSAMGKEEEEEEKKKSGVPERPFNTLTFVTPVATSLWVPEEIKNIETMNTEEQEDVLVHELLWILQGIDATLIRVKHHPEEPHTKDFTVRYNCINL